MTNEKLLNQRIEDLEKRIATLEKTTSIDQHPPQKQKIKKVSVKEFLLTLKLKSEIQKTLAIAYYLENYEELPNFNATDLEIIFRQAKEKPPKNINDAVNKNIAKGFFMETKEKKDNKKSWVLTSSGERCISETLGGNL